MFFCTICILISCCLPTVDSFGNPSTALLLATLRFLMCKPTSCVNAYRNERQIDMVSAHRTGVLMLGYNQSAYPPSLIVMWQGVFTHPCFYIFFIGLIFETFSFGFYLRQSVDMSEPSLPYFMPITYIFVYR